MPKCYLNIIPSHPLHFLLSITLISPWACMCSCCACTYGRPSRSQSLGRPRGLCRVQTCTCFPQCPRRRPARHPLAADDSRWCVCLKIGVAIPNPNPEILGRDFYSGISQRHYQSRLLNPLPISTLLDGIFNPESRHAWSRHVGVQP